MAALYLTLRDGVRAELPEEHCFLMGGEYGLSFIDLRSHWQNPPYALSFISSNFAPLRHLSRRTYRLGRKRRRLTRFAGMFSVGRRVVREGTSADCLHSGGWCLGVDTSCILKCAQGGAVDECWSRGHIYRGVGWGRATEIQGQVWMVK